ncbi:uncharacterized protein [Diadema antillarum]|uniref:uncharacterized protein n=1 Tax=Diadema antillarum TaxID=105358 RepID=UPI003A85C448
MGGHKNQSGNSQGSWFPTGYYGHFRSKHRNDFINQYRQQAKPSPPQKFHDKIADRPTHHHFSHHDNRFSFLNTVTSFEGKLGKRKVQSNNKSNFIPDFIAWVPHKRELESAGPKVSIYRDTFNTRGTSVPVPQILVPSVRAPRPPDPHRQPLLSTPFIDPAVAEEETEPLATTYQLTHRHSQPNRSINTNMNTGTIDTEPIPPQKSMAFLNPRVASIHERPAPSLTRLRRSRVASAPLFRSSVADCMVWHSHGDTEEVQVLPAHRPRPKTVIGLLPDISRTETGDEISGNTAVSTAGFSEPSHSSHFGITPSATVTVPMETGSMSASSQPVQDTSVNYSHAPTQSSCPQVGLSDSI